MGDLIAFGPSPQRAFKQAMEAWAGLVFDMERLRDSGDTTRLDALREDIERLASELDSDSQDDGAA